MHSATWDYKYYMNGLLANGRAADLRTPGPVAGAGQGRDQLAGAGRGHAHAGAARRLPTDPQ